MLLKNMHLAENEPHIVHDCDDELKMFKISKSDCEGDSRSLVYKILRTNRIPSTEKSSSSLSDDCNSDFEDILRRSLSLSPPSFPPEDSKLLSFDSGVTSEDVIPENYSNVVEIPYSLAVKPEPYTAPVKPVENQASKALRRSSRLQALQLKSNTSLDNVKQEENRIDIPKTKGLKRKRRRTLSKKRPSTKASGKGKIKRLRSSSLGNLSKSDERKNKKNKLQGSSVPKSKIKHSTDKSGKPSPSETRQMKLKSMLVVPSAAGSNTCVSSYPRKQEALFPKFANVDPSRVLSTLFQHRNTREFLSPKKPIALFFTKSMPLAFQRSGNHQYYFKRMQRELYYLRRKYQMLDVITLDNCYAMSGYSLKRTEVMLLDLISGKEVLAASYADFPSFAPNSLGSSNGFFAQPFYGERILFSDKESQSFKNLDKPLHNSNKLFRIALAEALKVLYCEES